MILKCLLLLTCLSVVLVSGDQSIPLQEGSSTDKGTTDLHIGQNSETSTKLVPRPRLYFGNSCAAIRCRPGTYCQYGVCRPKYMLQRKRRFIKMCPLIACMPCLDGEEIYENGCPTCRCSNN